jgi:hypothetical protein
MIAIVMGPVKVAHHPKQEKSLWMQPHNIE